MEGGSSTSIHPSGDDQLHPPLAYWARQWESIDYPPYISEGSFCSMGDCGPGGDCEENMQYREWAYNPTPTGEKPDILAPVHYAGGTREGAPFIHGGTSYAAPIVSGTIAWVLGLLLDNQLSPTPYEVRQAIIDCSVTFEPTTTGRLDAERLLVELTTISANSN